MGSGQSGQEDSAFLMGKAGLSRQAGLGREEILQENGTCSSEKCL